MQATLMQQFLMLLCWLSCDTHLREKRVKGEWNSHATPRSPHDTLCEGSCDI